MGPAWAVDGAALMLSLYVHRVSWDLTRKEPTVRRGPGVGLGANCSSRTPGEQGRQHAMVRTLAGRWARIRGGGHRDADADGDAVAVRTAVTDRW